MAKKRKFVFVLGAGASYGAGATARVQAGGKVAIPTQATFWQTFLRFCQSTKSRKAIESFLFRYFLNYRRVPSRKSAKERRRMLASVNVEEVFTFLSERVRAPSTSPQLRVYSREIWAALVSEIGCVFRRFEANQATRKTYRALINNHVRSHDSVIVFNYDTVFEQSLPKSREYEYVGIDGDVRGLPVLKPHGSINFQRRDAAIQVLDEPSQPLIVAPTHLKFVGQTTAGSGDQNGYLDQTEAIGRIWAEMEKKMRSARALVFIGYSFPVADLYFSSVFRAVLADRDTDPDIVIVNPDAVAIAARLGERFAITSVVRYFDIGQFVQTTRKNVINRIEAL